MNTRTIWAMALAITLNPLNLGMLSAKTSPPPSSEIEPSRDEKKMQSLQRTIDREKESIRRSEERLQTEQRNLARAQEMIKIHNSQLQTKGLTLKEQTRLQRTLDQQSKKATQINDRLARQRETIKTHQAKLKSAEEELQKLAANLRVTPTLLPASSTKK